MSQWPCRRRRSTYEFPDHLLRSPRGYYPEKIQPSESVFRNWQKHFSQSEVRFLIVFGTPPLIELRPWLRSQLPLSWWRLWSRVEARVPRSISAVRLFSIQLQPPLGFWLRH